MNKNEWILCPICGGKTIGHMIAQILEAWESLWEKVRQSREQKHRRLLEAWKQERLREFAVEKGYQIRFKW